MTVEIIQVFDAPLEDVFEAMTDHNRLHEIIPCKCERIVDGNDPKEPNGVGSVRRVSLPGSGLEETVTAFKRNEYMEYTVTRGPLIKSHHGVLQFWQRGGLTYLAYRIEVSTSPGLVAPVLEKVLEASFRVGLRKLARRLAAEKAVA